MKKLNLLISYLCGLLLTCGTAGLLASCTSNSTAGAESKSSPDGADSPVGKKITLGIIPLTDCAPLVVAHEKGFFKKYGLDVEISKEASWANVRDKILTGELDGAHCLFGMPFSVYTGVSGKAGSEMHIAMILNNNGQAITLSKAFCGKVGFRQISGVAAAVGQLQQKQELTFAMTYPGGTHDIWLRYWLAAAGVNQDKVKIITIPPPQMVANMKVGNMDGFCVGEPWNQVAVKQGIGFTHLASQDIWTDHPEKALVVNKQFSEGRREDLKKVMKAVLEAARWLDDKKNRAEAAAIIGKTAYVNAPAKEIEARLLGTYDLGCDYGQHTYQDDYMVFHKGGAVNYPRKAHGIWYLSQYLRFGYLKEAPDFEAVADKLILQDLYGEVAQEMGLSVPQDDMQPFRIKLDKVTFDPQNPLGPVVKK